LVAAIIQPELPGDQNDVIRVMSLHKSKGLTAKCVVVAGCVAEALPTFKSGLSSMERQQALEEQRRLFYVAITRTTQTLVLSGAPTVSYGEAMRMGLTVSRTRQGLAVLQASPYWSELGPQAPNPISGQGWRSALGF
jgi:superfamily I DNA/RNA helicase